MAEKQRVVRLPLDGLKTTQGESVVGFNNAWIARNCSTEDGTLTGDRRYYNVGSRSSASASDVCYGSGYGKYNANELQQLSASGVVTGGTFTITFNSETTAAIAYNATAADIQTAIENLTTPDVGDIYVYPAAQASPDAPTSTLNRIPMIVEFRGQYAGTNVSAMTTNSGSITGGGSIAVATKRAGGTTEQYVAAVKHNGDSTCNLYKITSSDSFTTCTYTSIATGLHASDWFFAQFGDSIYGINSTDGFLKIQLGGDVEDPNSLPSPPARAPTMAERQSVTAYLDAQAIDFSSGTTVTATSEVTSRGVTISTPAVTNNKITFNFSGTPTGANGFPVTIQSEWSSAQDWSANDCFLVKLENYTDYEWGGTAGIGGAPTFQASIVNNDGSPVTIVPYQSNNGTGSALLGTNDTVYLFFTFQGIDRNLRDNVDKLKIEFALNSVNDASISGSVTCRVWKGDNWLNNIKLTEAGVTTPKVDSIEYAYSYYDVSTGLESPLSPIGTIDSTPTKKGGFGDVGSYVRLTLRGSTKSPLTTSDYIYVYRKEKSTGLWRRLPTITTGAYDLANVASGSTTTYDDHYWEWELSGFPSLATETSKVASQYPEVIGVWKESLCIGERKQVFISRKGDPLNFAKSPDELTPEEIARLDALGLARPVTEYVSQNRSDDIKGIVGADAIYASTGSGMYVKIADFAAEAPGWRRLMGSRGTASKRATYPLSGGALLGSRYGLFYYEATRALGADNTLLPYEKELTDTVRKSWGRLRSQTTRYACGGAGLMASFTITVNGQTTSSITVDSTIAQVKAALEALYNVCPGDVEVFGDVFSQAHTENLFIRFVGRLEGTTVTTTFTPSGTGSLTAGTTDISTAGASGLVVVEHDDEIYCINGAAYLRRARTGQFYEGVFTDKVQSAVSVRDIGLALFTTDGQMMMLKTGQVEDNITTVKWEYQTGLEFSARQRITQIKALTDGSPTITVYADDGENGTTTQTYTLKSSSRFMTRSINNKAGSRHRLTLKGTVGTDTIHAIELWIQPEGDGYGT